MKIGIIAKTISNEVKTLIKAGEARGHEIEVLQPTSISIDKINIDPFFIGLKKFDLIYYRKGLDISTKTILHEFCKLSGVKFIDNEKGYTALFESKIIQGYAVSSLGIRTPTTYVYASAVPQFQEMKEKLGLPFIVKNTIGSQGKSVYMINNEDEFNALMLRQPPNRINSYLFQQFVKNDGDYRVVVVGNNVLGVMKRIPANGSYKANISQGGTGIHITDKKTVELLSEWAISITKHLNIKIAGVDFIQSLESGEIYFTEVNESPQWGGFCRYTNIDVPTEIIKYFETLV